MTFNYLYPVKVFVLSVTLLSVAGADLAFGQTTIYRSTETQISLTLERVSDATHVACVNEAMVDMLRVRVVDQNGDGVAGVSIDFAVTGTPTGATTGSFSTNTVTTDANGEAETAYTVGNMHGQYEISASTTSPEVTAGSPLIFTVTGVEITMTKPIAAAAKAAFNSDAVGRLEIENEATITPDNPDTRAFLAGRIRFEVDAIGASQLSWDNPGGVAVYSGGAFKVKAIFEGLPTNNSDFGEKEVRMIVDGCASQDDMYDIKVFYTATATNHPGGTATDPNWFYYYMQNAGGGAYTYDSSLSTSQSGSGYGEGTIRIADNAYAGGTYLQTSIVSGQLTYTGQSPTFQYYAHFIGVLEHERQHANNQLQVPGPPSDPDSDLMTSSYETATSSTDPLDQCSAVGYSACTPFTDQEVYAGGPIEEAAILGADTTNDWASPGTNW